MIILGFICDSDGTGAYNEPDTKMSVRLGTKEERSEMSAFPRGVAESREIPLGM